MKVAFTKHAREKLKRADVIKFKVSRKTIEKILAKPVVSSRTKYGDFVAIGKVNRNHILRVIYATINTVRKVITFHIARKGRYEN